MSLGHAPFVVVALSVVCLAPGSQAIKPSGPQGPDSKKIVIPKSLPPMAQRQITIEARGSSDWKKLNAVPLNLISKADKWITSLKMVSAQTRFLFNTPEGFGVNNGDVAIVNSSKFRAEFAHIYREAKGQNIHQGILVADGKQIETFDEKGWHQPQPVKAPRLPKPLFPAWDQNFQQFVFAGLGTNQLPLTELYKTATLAGFKSFTEQRSEVIQGNKFTQYRVVLSGVLGQSAKKARYVFEILLDAPTSAILKLTLSKKDSTGLFQSYWTVKWNRAPDQDFPASLFVLQKPATPG